MTVRYAVGLVVLAVGVAAALQASRALPSAEQPVAGVALPRPAAGSAWDTQGVREAYGRLPLAFVRNAGQTDPRVRYSAQAAGAKFSFTQKEVVLAFTKGTKGAALRLSFLEANRKATITGRRLGAGKVNYLLGSDPARWRTGLPTYGQVVYRDLWPGVDMAFRGAAGRLKYEFQLRPGAEVQRIRLAYRGAAGLAVDGAGSLRIGTALGVLTDAQPRSYQQVGGRRVPVASRFTLGGMHATAFGFAVGRYDRQRPLVIDPGLAYSTLLGGLGFDAGTIAVDTGGDAYLTGQTASADFPTSPGAFDTSHNGVDAFVTKLDPSGLALLYSTFLGGSDGDAASGIRLDAAGDAYVTGGTGSADFPTTGAAFDTTFNGGEDAFVAKLNPSGSALLYSTYLGGSGTEEGRTIALDAGGDAFLAGYTDAADFPTTGGAFDTSFNGVEDAFVAKLNPSGSALLYSTVLGGSSDDQGFGIAVDAAGDAYLTGGTSAADFPTSPGAFDTSHNGSWDAFVAKLNPSGSALLYSSFLGGSSDEMGVGIALDAAGDAYVIGFTPSADFPTSPGAFATSLNGDWDVFVTKLNPAGSATLYSTFLGGSADDQGSGIAVDPGGDAYLTGMTTSADFPTSPGAFDTSFNGGNNGIGDAFVTRLNPAGSAVLYSTFLGGSSNDAGVGIALDAAGSAYVIGNTTSTDFPTSPGAFDPSHNGDWDAFVTKLSISVNHAPVASDDGYATNQDTPLTAPAPGVLGNDSDTDGDPLTAALVAGPAHGTLTLHADGAFTYTPAAGFAGHDTFTYKANDGLADSNLATVTINHAPVASNDGYATAEDTPLTVAAPGVLGNDSDADSDPLTAALTASPAHGTLTLHADGAFTYTPAANFNGSDTFTYKANDARADSNTATVAITVTEVNDPPTAVADQATLAENTSTVIDVTANDTPGPSNEAGQALAVSSLSQPAHGQATLITGGADDGKVNYTPAANYAGPDAFTYTVCDDGKTNGVIDPKCDTASVDITVTAPVSANHAPVAQDDGYRTDEDTPLTVAAPGVLANDADADGDPLSVAPVTGPAHGTLTLNRDGSFTYTPAANSNGSDSFTYKASDGSADSNVATVTVTVAPVPDAPVARDDSHPTLEDSPLRVAAPGVLANDSDADGDPLTAALATSPAHGTLTLNRDGSFTYTPAANFNGTDTFTYKASDGALTSNVATVTITIVAVNDAPVARDDSYRTDEDAPLTVLAPGVLANDTDADGDPLSAPWNSSTYPAHGTLLMRADGSFTYTPVMGFNGQDSFTYTARDGAGASSHPATVTIVVAPKIAFSSTRDGNSEIYVMNSDGTGVTRLTTNTAFDTTPVWSPDHRRIAFTSISTSDGNSEIFVMALASDSGCPRCPSVTRLTNNPAIDGTPAWSPDGGMIAFSSTRDDRNGEIYVMPATGETCSRTGCTGARRLTSNTATDATPAWSPDGRRIAFSSTRDDSNGEIYVMNADGTLPTRLTTNPAIDALPDW